MSQLSRNNCRSVVYHVFLADGWLPAGTTPQTWDKVTMADIDFDDPALPGDPDFQKKAVDAQLQTAFLRLGARVPSAMALLKDGTKTLGDLSQWYFDSQVSL